MRKQQYDIEKLIRQESWREERLKLRSLALDCGLEESVKWGKLCYAFNGANVAIIFCLKNYCALGFFKGALLADENGLLVAPGKHSQAMRQLRFTSLQAIADSEDWIRACIRNAIQVERDGLEVAFEEKDNLSYPKELLDYLEEDPEFASAFDKLTPGRRRGYVLHYSQAKQSGTRTSRILRSRDHVLAGKGLTGR